MPQKILRVVHKEAQFLAAVGHPTRVTILRTLAAEGAKSYLDLSRSIGGTAYTTRTHVIHLERAGLVETLTGYQRQRLCRLTAATEAGEGELRLSGPGGVVVALQREPVGE